MRFTVTYDASTIPRWVDRMNTNVDRAVEATSVVIAAFAKDQVAVDTSSLQQTIDVEKDSRSGPAHPVYQVSAGNVDGGYLGGGKYDKEAGSPVDYAIEQEYGGSGGYRPYMTPASEFGATQLATNVGTAIRSTP